VAVWEAVSGAVEHARSGQGPTLVECKTTRWERHSAISAGKYDNEDEAMKWKTVDPIPRFEKVLVELGATDAQLEAANQAAKEANDEALEFAKESAVPGPETLSDYIFA
ncbi:MAG: thiamine pyrophosphate-dependent enzyme, partial [Chthoniobacterales bacterium]